MEDPKRLTHWRRPSQKLPRTEYGFITYGQWCEREVKRINDAGGDVEVVRNESGAVAIAQR